MFELYNYIKHAVVNFKLDGCCCILPLRIGLLVAGYFNILLAVLFLLGVSKAGIPPLLTSVQIGIFEDSSILVGTVAYSAELVFNTVLLCGVYRNDVMLLRMYMYFLIATIVSSVLVYSIVFMGLSWFFQVLIVWNIVFISYEILLVWSMIVELRQTETQKNGHVTLYSITQKPEEDPTKHEQIEIAVVEPVPQEINDDEVPHPEQKNDAPSTKLETVNESSKESDKETPSVSVNSGVDTPKNLVKSQ